MRKPGGYGQLICHDERAVAFDANGRTVGKECDTFSCKHCNRVVFVNTRDRPEDVGGFCRCCTGLICGPCVDTGVCTPLEQRLQAMEQRADALRSYGMG